MGKRRSTTRTQRAKYRPRQEMRECQSPLAVQKAPRNRNALGLEGESPVVPRVACYFLSWVRRAMDLGPQASTIEHSEGTAMLAGSPGDVRTGMTTRGGDGAGGAHRARKATEDSPGREPTRKAGRRGGIGGSTDPGAGGQAGHLRCAERPGRTLPRGGAPASRPPEHPHSRQPRCRQP